MNRFFRWVLAFLIAVHVWTQSEAQTLYNDELDALSKEIASNLIDQNIDAVAIWDFTDLDNNQTDLSKLVTSDFNVSLSKQTGIQTMDRIHLKTLMKEHNWKSEGLIDPSTAMKIGQFSDVQAIVAGSVVILGNLIRINVTAIGTNSAMTITAGSRTIRLTPEIESFLGISMSKEIQSDQKTSRRADGSLGHNNSDIDCINKELGDYCFKNMRNEQVYVAVHTGALTSSTLTLNPNQTQCFYGLRHGSYKYTANEGNQIVSKIEPGKFYNKGQIKVEKCKTKTFVLE